MAERDVSFEIRTSVNIAISSIDKLNNKLGSTVSTLSKLSTSAQALQNSFNTSSPKGIQQLTSNLNSVNEASTKTSKSIKSMFTIGNALMFVGAIGLVSKTIGKAIQLSMDYTETLNYFQQAFKTTTDTALAFQSKLQNVFGLSATNMMKYQATFKNMLSALGGIADTQTEKISETITTMAIDYSSLYNVDIQDSMKKFQSALSRQVRPIRSVSGYDITANVMQDFLTRMGITDRTYSQLSEMEKRLVIIYSLQQQMANSNALGDWARTIESPANQMRILKEQLIEVGRLIGSVFYGVVGSVLPYINGFIMAIKTLIGWLATLVGYNADTVANFGSNSYFDQALGDSTDAMDSLGTSADGATGAVSGTNSALDDTSKKLKEIKDASLGFDELHALNQTSTSDTSGTGSGVGGNTGGISGIDPRILKALGQYNESLWNTRMKALDVRDAILTWSKAIGASINDNIFKPIENSWLKYGADIYNNFAQGLGNIGKLASSVISTMANYWKPFFQTTTNLFFSLMQTGSVVFNTISKFILDVWKNGGKTLYEGISSVVMAFMNLGTAINDDVIIPIAKGFRDVVEPIAGSVFGFLLSVIGNVLKWFSNWINTIAKCKGAVVVLAGSIASLFAINMALKIKDTVVELGSFKNALMLLRSNVVGTGSSLIKSTSLGNKFYQVLGKMGNGIKAMEMGALNQRLLKLTKNFKNSIDTGANFGGRLNEWAKNIHKAKVETSAYSTSIKLKTMAEKGNKTAQTLLDNAQKMNIITENTATSAVIGHTTSVTGLTLSERIATVATGLLSKALTFLAMHPLLIVGTAIIGLVSAIALLATNFDFFGKKSDDNLEKVKAKLNSVSAGAKELHDDVVNMTNGWSEALQGSTDEYDKSLIILNQLQSVTKNGVIPDTLQNKKLVEQINNLLPDSVTWVDGIGGSWNKSTDELRKYALQLLETKQLEAYVDEVIEARKKLPEAYAKETESLKTYKDAQNAYNVAFGKYYDGVKDYMTLDQAKRTFDADKAGKEYYKTLIKAKSAYNDNKNSVENLESAEKRLGIASKGTNASLKEKSKLLAEQYTGTTLSTTGMNKLGGAYKTLSERAKNAVGEEKTLLQNAMVQVSDYYTKKAMKNSETYNGMIIKARTYGIDLSNITKGQWQGYKDTVSKYGKEAGDKVLEGIRNGSITSYSEAMKYANKIQKEGKESIEKNPPNPKVKYSKDKKSMDNAKDIGGIKTTVKYVVDQLSKQQARDDFFKTFRLKVKFNGSGSKIVPYATGGFPADGSLFIAREPGNPELVGSVGGKTAVMNNNQITQSVSSAVFDAIAPLFKGQSTSAGKISVFLDGRELAYSTASYGNAKGYKFKK